MTYRTDYHIHTLYSDGMSAPEEYITSALNEGLNEIGFSDHITLFNEPQEGNINHAEVKSYIDCLEKLKIQNEKIIVRKGLEVDYFPGKEAQTKNLISDLDLDYTIGSVHYLGDLTMDYSPVQNKNDKAINQYFESYFEAVVSAASSGLFDILGHCDLIRIYGFRPTVNPEPLYRKLARTMRANDIAFEVNTNGRNRPLADFYPDRQFLYIFREENIPVCVNSDAHMPSRVGQYFDEAFELLRYTGFSEMAVFENRKRRMVHF